MTGPSDFVYEAYGPDIADVGAVCFFSGNSASGSALTSASAAAMAAERRRVFRRINELAAAGNADMAYLAEEFARPEQLLGGGQDDGGQ